MKLSHLCVVLIIYQCLIQYAIAVLGGNHRKDEIMIKTGARIDHLGVNMIIGIRLLPQNLQKRMMHCMSCDHVTHFESLSRTVK